MYWNHKGKFRFKIHMKENQKLKYLNKGSCHTSKCFLAIPNGVFKRLYKLTSSSKKMLNQKVDKIYPEHTKAMNLANLVLNREFPRMKLIKMMIEKCNEMKNDKDKKKRRHIS